MAAFEMRNFNHFPMEKTSYDLKLELLEELSPKEALELMKANSGFRSIYLKEPWRIFGRHVRSIYFLHYKFEIEVCKLNESKPLSCDSRHLPLLKKIKSCLEFNHRRWDWTQQTIDTERKILSNLDSIGEWGKFIRDLKDFQECFSNFKGQITDFIHLSLNWYSGAEDDPNLSIISKVFETQLGRCNSVSVDCGVDQFSIICKLFSKTRIKRIDCKFDSTKLFSETNFEKAIRWIVCNGIPSQHREISIRFVAFAATHHFLDKFFSAFPGMQQLSDEKYIHSYRRKIDDKGDCVFEWKTRHDLSYFKAKYVPAQAQ